MIQVKSLSSMLRDWMWKTVNSEKSPRRHWWVSKTLMTNFTVLCLSLDLCHGDRCPLLVPVIEGTTPPDLVLSFSRIPEANYCEITREKGEMYQCVWTSLLSRGFVVYYESRKRELKIRLMNEGRCDERLKARVEESTCLTYTGLTSRCSSWRDCLLWIDKARAKDKTYIWVSVWWQTTN
jgi:hypothetical protein